MRIDEKMNLLLIKARIRTPDARDDEEVYAHNSSLYFEDIYLTVSGRDRNHRFRDITWHIT
jgi:hypothetical protein